MKLRVIALTHFHGDHIFGLPGLLQTMMSMGRTERLFFVGPKGLREFVTLVLKLAGYLSFEVAVMETEEASICLHDLDAGWPALAVLKVFPTSHRVPSCGYVFELGRAGKFDPAKAKALDIPVNEWRVLQKGKTLSVDGRRITPGMIMGAPRKGLKVVVSGDTEPCKPLYKNAQNADLLICEGTYGDDVDRDLAKERGHMTFSQAARVAQQAEVSELWLTHYSQRLIKPENYLHFATERFERTVCGYDGLHQTLSFEKDGEK